MLKVKTENLLGFEDIKMLYCDNCGEGISLGNSFSTENFITAHLHCTKEKNINIDMSGWEDLGINQL